MPPSQTIVKTTSGQYFRVSAYEDPNLSHLWSGHQVKKSAKGKWTQKFPLKGAVSVRKEDAEIVEGGDA